ncbi:M23 family metallopeptidase [Paractinoplanes abujensis]|uniref:Murein DD-endopeptidase MepM/ murein hydrolase activator NlpD n=1 Tax=Paractinoplanes abujensis TaxID=882441 RepID=A0A7W7CXF6_9ACTN|nr:M23 family metallopeptidase [Actinoplanes abujensis]MBB4695255.1 murein DD-endopeptidase MepM/ murein hydrolase activator NlpD [Actinoplanes abujensis]
MRQRLSSEPDRYRGRRRVPTPPRSRYAVAVTAAFAGAGVVAIGAASNFPDQKNVDPQALQAHGAVQSVDEAIADRAADDSAASRSNNRDSATKQKVSADEATADVWLLPMDDFQFTSAYGVRWGKLHAGIDLAGPEGMPYKAIHAGKVTKAGYYGGYGYQITIQDTEGNEVIYAHSRRLLVKAGDEVKAGQVIGLVGNTGASYGTHLHLEIHVNGTPTDPIPFLRDRGVDIKLRVESVFAGVAAAS